MRPTFVPWVLLVSVAAAQEPPKRDAKEIPGVDQRRVDEAIRKGIEYLKVAGSPAWHHIVSNSDELILYTFGVADVPPSDPEFKALWGRILEEPPPRTYKAALQAMLLEELDRVKYQSRIVTCGQFLVDNQCGNGQWSYGEPVPGGPGDVPSTDPVASGGRNKVGERTSFETRVKPKVLKKVVVRRTGEGPATGDNSNSQYAALGLRACFDAGVVIPRETTLRAKKWWVESQHRERKDSDDVATGGSGPARGWCYDQKDAHPAYGSMTAGAVGALVIYDYILGKDYKRDPAVKSGLAWLGRNFSVTENPGPPEFHGGGLNHYYYLYALERVGVLYDTPKIGDRPWYADGAKVILDQQRPDGSWEGGSHPVWDTCYAILFLKRATRPLVPSVDGLKPREK